MSGRAPLAMVVAASRNGVIGRDGGLPWHIPEDLKHFRAVTLDHAVIMGRKTYESIGKPLPKRRNIVVTHNRHWTAAGCEVAHSLEAAIARARETDAEPRIIGGNALFSAGLPLATRIFYTRVEREVEGDTFFPAIEWSEAPEATTQPWRVVESRAGEGVTYLTLDRVA